VGRTRHTSNAEILAHTQRTGEGFSRRRFNSFSLSALSLPTESGLFCTLRRQRATAGVCSFLLTKYAPRTDANDDDIGWRLQFYLGAPFSLLMARGTCACECSVIGDHRAGGGRARHARVARVAQATMGEAHAHAHGVCAHCVSVQVISNVGNESSPLLPASRGDIRGGWSGLFST
jgi:hypothetical protein